MERLATFLCPSPKKSPNIFKAIAVVKKKKLNLKLVNIDHEPKTPVQKHKLKNDGLTFSIEEKVNNDSFCTPNKKIELKNGGFTYTVSDEKKQCSVISRVPDNYKGRDLMSVIDVN